MYNKGTSSVKERESVEAREHASKMRGNLDYILAGGKTIDKFLIDTEKKLYHTPTVELENNPKIIEMVKASIVSDEDVMPSNTTMQFDKNGNPEIFDDVRSLSKSESKVKREYSISAKGKVLIAVYALVVATIFSLIMLNSRMLKNLDNSINNYSSQVSELSKEYSQVMGELDVAMSDETIIEKALEMGMEKA